MNSDCPAAMRRGIIFSSGCRETASVQSESPAGIREKAEKEETINPFYAPSEGYSLHEGAFQI